MINVNNIADSKNKNENEKKIIIIQLIKKIIHKQIKMKMKEKDLHKIQSLFSKQIGIYGT